MRQADLAELLGQTQATISRVERGERRLDVVELRAWLTALDISFVSFVKQLDARLSQRPEQLLRFTTAANPRKRGRQ